MAHRPGLGLQDSLSTLWLMGLDDDFEKAGRAVRNGIVRDGEA